MAVQPLECCFFNPLVFSLVSSVVQTEGRPACLDPEKVRKQRAITLRPGCARLLQERQRGASGVSGVWNQRVGLRRSLPDSCPLPTVSVQQLLLQSLRRSHDPVRTARASPKELAA